MNIYTRQRKRRGVNDPLLHQFFPFANLADYNNEQWRVYQLITRIEHEVYWKDLIGRFLL
jgi:hypothetical protein